MDPVMFTSLFLKILIFILKLICATPENQTSYITMRPTMLTVSNSTEKAGQEDTSYFPYQAPMDINTGNVMETSHTTMHLLNFTDSDEPKPTQHPSNLIENVIFQFHSKAASDVPLPELYIGMKAYVSVTVIYPYGFYDQITIKVDAKHDKIPSPYFEMLSMSCLSGRAIKSGDDTKEQKKSTYNIVKRLSMLGQTHKFVNISHSTNEEDRMEICNFTVFLHESPGITDGQNISLTALLEISTETKHILEKTVRFIARTSVLERNKIVYCEPNSTLPQQINATIKEIKTFLIHCWIPFYLPKIQITISEKSDLTNNSLSGIFIEVESYGFNFEPMNSLLPNVWPLCSGFYAVPTFFINRGYYSSEETTEADLVVFKVSMSLSASVVIGNNYFVSVQVKSQFNDVWNHTFVIIPETYLETVPYNIELKHLSPKEELLPSKEALIHLKITVLAKISERITLNISTVSQSKSSDSVIGIQTLRVGNENKQIECVTEINNDLNGYGNQTKLHILLQLSNVEDIPRFSTWVFGVKMIDGVVKFGETQLFVVATDHYNAEIVIPVNKPEVLHDKSGNISSEIYKLLDRNLTSCMRIPVQGDNPPLLQMKIKTSWLRISSSAYNVTLIGENISCQPHGGKMLQVSYPVKGSNGRNHDHMKYCILLSGSTLSSQLLQKCVYLCSCTNNTECQELFIFMANDSKTSIWKLCELEAINVE